jgi:hypothetical protein
MAKTITEIFKDKPDLLQCDEVKELIEQFRLQFSDLKRKHYNYWDSVTTVTMNSELYVINGTSCKDAIDKINNLSFETKNL